MSSTLYPVVRRSSILTTYLVIRERSCAYIERYHELIPSCYQYSWEHLQKPVKETIQGYWIEMPKLVKGLSYLPRQRFW